MPLHGAGNAWHNNRVVCSKYTKDISRRRTTICLPESENKIRLNESAVFEGARQNTDVRFVVNKFVGCFFEGQV